MHHNCLEIQYHAITGQFNAQFFFLTNILSSHVLAKCYTNANPRSTSLMNWFCLPDNNMEWTMLAPLIIINWFLNDISMKYE